MKVAGLTFVILISAMLCLPQIARGGELSGIRKNNAGARKLVENKPVEAYGDFSEALGQLPFAPEVHFNLGNAFLVNKEYDKAVSEFTEAGRLAPGDSERATELRFRALFNSGFALAEAKRVDEALEAYQAALELKPDSLETKTNIELLTKQGGEGQGESDQDKPDDKKDQKKDGQGNQQQQQQPQKPNDKQEKQQPKPFKSEQLTKQDVNRILDELKRQEESIRAKMEHQETKDAPPDKDW